MTVGLLLLRLGIGVPLVGHGLRKLIRRLGPGPVSTGAYFERIGYRPGVLFAVIAGLTETAGGALFLAGVLTPLAAAMVLGVMANAVRQGLAHGFWAENGGCEYPLFLGLAALALAFTGPGAASVDDALGLDLAGPAWAGAAVVLAGLTAVPVLLLARPRTPAAQDSR
jgi:putative oxidoreductase